MIYTASAPSACTRFSTSLSLDPPPPFPLIRTVLSAGTGPRSSPGALHSSRTRVMRRYAGFMGIFMRIYRAWSRRCPRRGYTGPTFRRAEGACRVSAPLRIYNTPRIVPCSTGPLFSRFAPPGHTATTCRLRVVVGVSPNFSNRSTIFLELRDSVFFFFFFSLVIH